jgi:uncharacterized SAM-binding protein YcdF (DUF218 family)
VTILLIFFLFVTTNCLAICQYIKTSIIIFIISFGCFITIGSGLLPFWLSSYFAMPLPAVSSTLDWKKKNAIVLLGTGTVTLSNYTIQPSMTAFSRIYTAARLYLSCKKSKNQCTIVISGGDTLHTGAPEATVYRDALRRLNINSADIQLEQHSINTYQNAKLTSLILKKENFDRVFLVTSGIHLKRAILYFSYFGIHTTPIAADFISPHLSIIPLGYNFTVTDFMIRFYINQLPS